MRNTCTVPLWARTIEKVKIMLIIRTKIRRFNRKKVIKIKRN